MLIRYGAGNHKYRNKGRIDSINSPQDASKELEELQLHCKSIQEKLETAESNSNASQHQHQEYLEKLQVLETELAAAQKQSQVYKKRLDQTLSGHGAQITELTEKFMSDTQQSQMINQAQLQNLQSEHTEMMRELREQHETEKEVWSIEEKAAIDEIRRDAQFEKEEAVRELTNEWNDKNEDLHASMSKDAMEIQKHWESKLEEAKAKAGLKESRLQGEIEVIKDRLGREIHRRKQNQAALAEALEKIKLVDDKSQKYQKKRNELLKNRTAIEKEISQVKFGQSG
jgi:chromosome segregation ATPase